MAKLHGYEHHADGQVYIWGFHCPGCGYDHGLAVRQYLEGGNPVWEFNGDQERPTFTPSLIVFKDDPEKVCHVYITDGSIQFLPDCHHGLAGQTVEIPEWEETR